MIVAIKKRVPMINVLATQRNFTSLWTGQLISFIGDNVYKIALAWQVLILTGSALAIGIVYIANLIPTIVFVLIGGVTADRLPRRSILLLSDAGRGLVVLLTAVLAFAHLLQLWHLLLLSLFFGAVDSFYTPASQAIVPQLVEVDLLQPANALSRLSFMASRVLGPPLGALAVVATGGPASAFALDALSFLFCCLLVLRLPMTPQEDIHRNRSVLAFLRGIPASVQGLFASMREGLAYVTGKPWLWATIAIAACINVTYMVPLAVALPKLVYHYGAGAWLLGLLTASDAAGAIIASLALGQMSRLRQRGLVAYAALFVSCLGLAALGLPLSRTIEPTVALVACFFAGGGVGAFEVLWLTLMQERVPGELFGRVTSIDMLGSLVLIPLGLIGTGGLVDRFGPAPIFLVGGLLSLILVIAGLCVRDIRDLA